MLRAQKYAVAPMRDNLRDFSRPMVLAWDPCLGTGGTANSILSENKLLMFISYDWSSECVHDKRPSFSLRV